MRFAAFLLFVWVKWGWGWKRGNWECSLLEIFLKGICCCGLYVLSYIVDDKYLLYGFEFLPSSHTITVEHL